MIIDSFVFRDIPVKTPSLLLLQFRGSQKAQSKCIKDKSRNLEEEFRR